MPRERLLPRPHMAFRAFTRARIVARRRITAVPRRGASHSTVASAREETRMSQNAWLADDEDISVIYSSLPPGKRSQAQLAAPPHDGDGTAGDTAPRDTTAPGG